jgi:hypothetical protein
MIYTVKVARRIAERKALSGDILAVRFTKDLNPIDIEALKHAHSVRRTLYELIRGRVITHIKIESRCLISWYEIAEENGNG